MCVHRKWMNHICIPTEKCLQREVGIYILSMKSAAAPELYCAGLLFDLKKAAAAQLFWGKVECGVCVHRGRAKWFFFSCTILEDRVAHFVEIFECIYVSSPFWSLLWIRSAQVGFRHVSRATPAALSYYSTNSLSLFNKRHLGSIQINVWGLTNSKNNKIYH